MRPLLEVEHLSYSYDSTDAVLRDISFSVQEGESLGIVGGNGAGKSTLIWCVLGLLKAKGTVRLLGEHPSKSNLARVGVVFQNPEDMLFMPTLLDDVTLPLINRGADRQSATDRAQEVLGQVGLQRLVKRPATQISLGERKRASIAAALAGRPDLLMLDEPTAELDGRSVRQLKETLNQLKIAQVITSHNIEFLRGLTSRTLVLCEGAIIAEGPSNEILSDRSVIERAGLI
jgi:cobalt/nickel transport system ATP-binding protein